MRALKFTALLVTWLMAGVTPVIAQNSGNSSYQDCMTWVEAIPVAPEDQSVANTQCLNLIGAGEQPGLLTLLDQYIAQNGQFIDPIALGQIALEKEGALQLALESIVAQSARRQDIEMGRSDIAEMIERAKGQAPRSPLVISSFYFADSMLALSQGDMGGMRQSAEAALSYVDEDTARPLRTRILVSIGVAATQQGDVAYALENYEAAIDSARKDGNYFRMATTSANIGSLFSSLGDDQQAMEYYTQALAYSEQSSQTTPMFESGMLANIGTIFTDKDQHEEAISYYVRAEKILEDLNRRDLAPVLYFSYAQSLFEIGQAKRSIDLATDATDQALSQGNTPLAGLILVWLAEKQLDRGEFYLAQDTLIKASEVMGVSQQGPQDLSLAGKESYWTRQYAEGMARMLAATGSYELAAGFADVAFEMHQKIFESKAVEAAVNSKLLFELRSGEQALIASQQRAALAEEQALVETLRSERTQMIAVMAIITALAAILIGLFIYRSFKAQKRLADTRSVFLKETHHRIKNNLQMLTSILRRESANRARKGDVDRHRDILGTTERLRAMALVQDYLYTNEESTVVSSLEYFTNLFEIIQNSLDREDVKVELDIDDTSLDAEIAMRLGLFAFEALSNSMKHAFATKGGKLSIMLKRGARRDLAELTVRDNGEGDPELASKDGNGGLSLIRDFAEMLGAKLYIKSDAHGTELALRNFRTV